MDSQSWEALKASIEQKVVHTREGVSKCHILSVKNQMLTRVNTLEEVLSVMKTYEQYKEYNDNEIHNETK